MAIRANAVTGLLAVYAAEKVLDLALDGIFIDRLGLLVVYHDYVEGRVGCELSDLQWGWLASRYRESGWVVTVWRGALGFAREGDQPGGRTFYLGQLRVVQQYLELG